MSEQMFYCTTGWQDGFPSMVHPFIADSEWQARAWMDERYGGKWCTSYTAAQWAAAVKEADERGYMIERELPTVDIRGWRPKDERGE